MNYFTTTQTPSTSSIQSPLSITPSKGLKYNDDEKKALLTKLTYLVPGYHTIVPSRGGRTGKLKFPTPDQAAKLNKVFSMVKTYERTQIISTTTVPTGGAFYFDYNSINDSGSLTGVFDQYRIGMVEITFIPDATVSQLGTVAPPLFATCVDKDDSAAITLVQIGDYPGAKVTLGVHPHTHTFVPAAALAAYSGTFTSYSMVEAPWIDVASPSVQHYGVKYAFSAATSVVAYEVRVRIMLHLKQVR
jgi:hypothetical protein